MTNLTQTPENNEINTETASKQNHTRHAIISAIIATFLLLTFVILFMVGDEREYSENENRYLAKKPSFSFSSIKDGKFMEDTDAYISDQFALRDSLVKTRTKIDIFLGKREINGVYIGRRHFLFEKPSVYNEEKINKTVKTMNALRADNKSIRSYIAIAPNSTEIVSKYMPFNAPNQNQTEQIEKVYGKLKGFNCIDICTPLKEDKEPEKLYYKTDHHWTAKATGIAFNKIAKNMNINTKGYKYKNLAVTNSFQGTLSSSSGIFSAKDTVYITIPKPDVEYTVFYVEENKTKATVFNSAKLKEKSKYEVFFGGNYSQIIINTKSKSDRVLLVIKDSYANSMIPMLIPHFKTIIMVDPRYYNDKIQDTIDKEGVTDMLWLYNANTFLNDTSIVEKFS